MLSELYDQSFGRVVLSHWSFGKILLTDWWQAQHSKSLHTDGELINSEPTQHIVYQQL